jgi:hypothetical protein
MNSKGILKIILPLVIGVLLFSLFLISCTPRKYSGSSAVTAVPESTPVFFKINDAVKFVQALGAKNEWWKLLGNIGKVETLQNYIQAIDSTLKGSPDFKKFIGGKEIVLSLSSTEVGKINGLIIVPLCNIGDKSLADDIIEGIINTRSLLISKSKFNKVPLYELSSNGKDDFGFTYTYYKDFLIIGSKSFMVEESIRKLGLNSKDYDYELAPLLKTINNQAELNIFINHRTAGGILSKLSSDQIDKKLSLMSNFSGWTELDATIRDDKVILSGFTNGDSQKNYFSNIFLHQQPGISKIESVLPTNIDYFSSYYISNIKLFFNEYKKYLDKLNLFPDNQKQLTDIEKATGIDLKNLFIEVFDSEIAESGISIDPPAKRLSKILIVKTKSGSVALKKMIDFQETYIQSSKNSSIEWEKEFKIDNQTNIKLYKFPVENMPGLLFGNLFANMETSWFTVFNNYLIFADSYSALEKVILSNVLGETLIADSDYIKFQSGLTSKNNYYFFCNSSVAYREANQFFNREISDQISTNSEFGKFKYIAWQVSTSGNMVYNNSCMFYSPEMRAKPQTVWQSHLNSTLSKKPLIIENRYDQQENEIVLADFKNNLYLLNNVGRIVWQINTGSPILSEIHLIDYNKSGDYNLVFNTNEKLFIVDKKGKDIENFPVNFSANATNGVSVFDYENTKNYRFFVATDDQKINAYDSDGKLLDGWEPFKTDHVVNQPIQHFSIDGKDYIIASDQMRDYIFDRKGNIRVPTDVVYQHSVNNRLYLERRTSLHEPRLVTTDSNGKIHRTYFDGTHEVVDFNELNDSHYFLAANTDEDKETEYLFVQGNHIVLQNNDGTTIFNLLIECEITSIPTVFNFSDNEKRIGVCCAASNKILLFNANGTICTGFPLDGCTEFNIGFISDNRSNFNLLVGSPEGYLYNYLVK